MNKQDAKRIVYSFLVQHLDPAVIDEFLRAECHGQAKDYRRLTAAAEDIQTELRRRAGEEID
jgi:hypothetical protein